MLWNTSFVSVEEFNIFNVSLSEFRKRLALYIYTWVQWEVRSPRVNWQQRQVASFVLLTDIVYPNTNNRVYIPGELVEVIGVVDDFE